MKKIIQSFFAGLSALGLVLLGVNTAFATGGGGNHKIVICHVEPKKNPHKAHGDYKGACKPDCQTSTVTVEVPGPTVTATKTVEVPGPTVTTTVPGPETTKTVTAPAETVTATVPGPTTTVTETAPVETVTATATATETVPGPTVTFTETAPVQTVTATSVVTETATSTVTATATETATAVVTETATLPAATVTATETSTVKATTETTKIKTIVSDGGSLAKTGLDWPAWVWWLIVAGIVGGGVLVATSKTGYKRKH